MPGFGSLAPDTSSEDDLLNRYYDPGTGMPAPGPDRYQPRRPWIMEPDLLETQTGRRNYPPGISAGESGEPVSDTALLRNRGLPLPEFVGEDFVSRVYPLELDPISAGAIGMILECESPARRA